jgi:hypothetical protein
MTTTVRYTPVRPPFPDRNMESHASRSAAAVAVFPVPAGNNESDRNASVTADAVPNRLRFHRMMAFVSYVMAPICMDNVHGKTRELFQRKTLLYYSVQKRFFVQILRIHFYKASYILYRCSSDLLLQLRL